MKLGQFLMEDKNNMNKFVKLLPIFVLSSALISSPSTKVVFSEDATDPFLNTQIKKANIDDEFNLYNLNYEHSLFVYPFVSQEIPKFIGVVPEVVELNVLPTKEHLDSIYEKYCAKVNRNVEGFVINYKNIITKYVRMKNGKLQEHFDREE